MKSENNKWSDKDVDELLTTFFRTEVPAQLDGPLRLSRSNTVQGSRVAPEAGSRAASNWINLTVISCVAALMIAAMLAFQGGGTNQPAAPGVVVQPSDTDDEPINVGEAVYDESDIAVPEQDIELTD